MRIAAQWIYDKEGFRRQHRPGVDRDRIHRGRAGRTPPPDRDHLTGIGVRRMRRGGGEPSTLVRVGAVLATIALAAYLVAVWAMTAKPD